MCCGFAKLEGLYLINGIIRTKVLDRFANTIVNQNSFQVSGEFLDQRQNLILLNRGNHLDRKRNWITFAQRTAQKSKGLLITCTSLKTFLTPSRVVQTIGSMVLVSGISLQKIQKIYTGPADLLTRGLFLFGNPRLRVT